MFAVIPMAITFRSLYFPFSPAIHFGKLGRIIGDEIAHSFEYGSGTYAWCQGNDKEWLSFEDIEKFNANAKCFVEQYNGYEVLPGKWVNGTPTLDENIADNVGLHAALRAYTCLVQDAKLQKPK